MSGEFDGVEFLEVSDERRFEIPDGFPLDLGDGAADARPVTFYGSKESTRGIVRRLDWPALCEFVHTAKAHAGDKATVPMWTAADFGGGAPKLANVRHVSWLVYDIDGGAVTRLEAVSLPVACIAHASFSHSPAVEKFRLCIRTSRIMTAEEYRLVWPLGALMLGALGVEVDGSAKDPSRRWFVPVRHKFYGVSMNGGQPALDVDEALVLAREFEAVEEAGQPKRVVSKPSHARGRRGADPVARATAYLAAMDPSISGQGGQLALFRAACALVRGFELDATTARALLLEHFNPRCIPPWHPSDVARKVEHAATAGMPLGYLLSREVA